MTTPNTTASGAADTIKDLIRAAGGIVHSDGNIFFTNANQFNAAALAASAPVAPNPPDWRELCRRLYVELFHCDKQMTCSLNEDGEPIWRTGTEVRDVLSDAKAALEANTITREAAPVAPAPQPAPMPYPTDAQIDAVYEQTMGQHLRSQDTPAVRRFGRAMFLYAWNAAAPKAAPAINKVSTIIDAYGMTPGQPERVADIPGLAEALEAAFADGSAQVTGAAQAAPDVVEELIRERDHRDEIIDALCDAVLEDRPEWSSSYYFEDAVVAVQERIAELEARNECRDLNAQAAPAPASGETETCKCCGEGSARIVVRRECETCTSVYAGVAEHRLQKSLAEPPAQEALLNPDMPTQELRLHMGELTTDEVLVARAAIRWANTYGITAAQK